MERAALIDLVERVASRDLAAGDRDVAEAQVADLTVLQRWVEAGLVGAAARLRQLAGVDRTLIPEMAFARAADTELRPAEQAFRRAFAVGTMPQLGQVLEAGTATVAHVDVVASALRRMEPSDRPGLLAEGERIAQWATELKPSEFARAVADEVNRIAADDGVDRLRRQRRAVRLRTWRDHVTHMVHIAGQFDEEYGAMLLSAVHQRSDALFHGNIPDTAPADLIERQRHLDGLALIDLITHGGSMRVTMGVLVDHRTLVEGLHAASVVDIGEGELHVPVATLRRWACEAQLLPVVLDGAGLPLDVGRAQRLATPAQRWALRAIYRTCTVPGCATPFERCTVHHIDWWTRFGPTDLDNLLPLCGMHHTAAHEGGWQVELEPGTRRLLLTLPDGRVIHDAPRPTMRAG